MFRQMWPLLSLRAVISGLPSGLLLGTAPGRETGGPLDYVNQVNPWASLLAQSVKNPPAMQETLVPSLGQEDSPEKEMTTHSSILA